MSVSEDRISHLAHEIVERLWRDDLADLGDERRALDRVKESLAAYFHVAEEIEEAVRATVSGAGYRIDTQSDTGGNRG